MVSDLDRLEFLTRATLEIATRAADEQRAITERAEDALSRALDAFETAVAQYSRTLEAIAEGQRRIARIRDVRENL